MLCVNCVLICMDKACKVLRLRCKSGRTPETLMTWLRDYAEGLKDR